MSDYLLDLIRRNRLTPRLLRKLQVYWRLTADLAELSTCRRSRVGAVLVPQDLSGVMAVGYNGPPAGLPNDGCRDVEGDCGCVHAESNCAVKAPPWAADQVMLSTTAPCELCAGLIVNCRRVSAVVYGADYRDSRGLSVLRAAGLTVATASDLGLRLLR